MQADIYLVDCGYLIKEGEEDFDGYNNVYDKKWGYYDDDQYYSDQSLAELKAMASKYVAEDEGAYVVISLTFLPDYVVEDALEKGEEISSLDVEDEDYSLSGVVYSIANIDGEIVENFVKTG